jgi:dual specificity MAP kinase phosphatase
MRELTKASEIITVSADPPPTVMTNARYSPTHPYAQLPAATAQSQVWTTANHWDHAVGQVFLGNSNDVPVPSPFVSPRRRLRKRAQQQPAPPNGKPTGTEEGKDVERASHEDTEMDGEDDPFDCTTNDPRDGLGYDICVECLDAPFPSQAHLRAAEEHVAMLERVWAERCTAAAAASGTQGAIPVRPPPNANAVIHLSVPCSPPSTSGTMAGLIPFVKFVERMLLPCAGGETARVRAGGKRWSLISSFPALSSAGRARSGPPCISPRCCASYSFVA